MQAARFTKICSTSFNQSDWPLPMYERHDANDDDIAVALGHWPLAPNATLWFISTFLPSSACFIFDFRRNDRFANACQIQVHMSHYVTRVRLPNSQWEMSAGSFASLHCSWEINHELRLWEDFPEWKPGTLCLTVLYFIMRLQKLNRSQQNLVLISSCCLKSWIHLNQRCPKSRTTRLPDGTSRMQYAVSCKGP